MSRCPVPLRVSLGPCGQYARRVVERDMGFVGERLVCVAGHSQLIALAGLEESVRIIGPGQEQPEPGGQRRNGPVRPCARVGCEEPVKLGARYCSHQCAARCTGARKPRSVWPEDRRQAFIADYAGGVSMESLAMRYQLASAVLVSKPAAKFRRMGYAVPYVRAPRAGA